MQRSSGGAVPTITADGDGIAGHAGARLLSELADWAGLTAALDARPGSRRARRSKHRPGTVLRDIAVMLADGGDCLSDLAVLRDQPQLFGEVAPHATAWRVLEAVAADELGGVDAIRAARAAARARVWAAGGVPLVEGLVTIDFDATLLTAHSDKAGAAPTYKKGYGFHPLLAYLDRGDGTGEPLAGVLRPGNAGSNTAEDHLDVLEMALAQLPAGQQPDRVPVLARSDSAGATHAFVAALREAGVMFSVGFDATAAVREAVLAVPAVAWVAARRQDGERREGAEVAELHGLDLSGWPPGTRAIVRRERPHPGAQLSFSDADGHRFQVFISDQPDSDIAELERRHRAHARVEDRIRTAKDTGLRNLPFADFQRNEVWLELVLAAQDLLAWAQTLCLDGQLAVAEPKTLRYRLLHVAARVARHARRWTVRLQAGWPWVDQLAAAFTRLRALPAPA